MEIDTEKILVLKAYYMRRVLVNKNKNLHAILDSINTAIMELELRKEEKDKFRQIFYLLLKAEILRDSYDVIDLRKRTKEISEHICSNVYNYFMAIEEASETTNKAHGIQTGIISNDGVKSGLTIGINSQYDDFKYFDSQCDEGQYSMMILSMMILSMMIVSDACQDDDSP